MKGINAYYIAIGIVLSSSCNTWKQPKSNEQKNLEVVYSGWWKNITTELGKNIVVIKTKNCELKIKDTQIEMRPISVGLCAILILHEGKEVQLEWQVIQLPDPKIFLGNPLHSELIIDWEKPDSYFIDARFENLSKDIYFNPVGKMYTYVKPKKFEVDMFTMEIFNNRDSLVYENVQFGNGFSCEDFNMFRQYSKEHGVKIVIKEVNVVYPDGTNKYFAMDTIRY